MADESGAPIPPAPPPAASAAPTPTPSAPTPATPSQVLDAGQSWEQARATIRDILDNPNQKDFRAKVAANEPEARQIWDRLHALGWPQAEAPAPGTPADAQLEKAINDRIADLPFAVSKTDRAQMRAGVVWADEHAAARTKLSALAADRGWRQRYFSGDVSAKEQWARLQLIAGQRPVPRPVPAR